MKGMTFKEFLVEKRLGRDDPDMMDYDRESDYEPGSREAGGEHEENVRIGDAPYFVAWSSQSFDEENFKPKGDGGRIVAINVPDYETARKIEAKIEEYHAQEKLDGFSYGLDHYHGTYTLSMDQLKGQEWRLKYDRPKDFSK